MLLHRPRLLQSCRGAHAGVTAGLFALGCAVLAACNVLTGADSLELEELDDVSAKHGGDGPGQSGGAGDPGGVGNGGSGSTGTGAGSGAGTDTSTATEPEPPPLVAAAGLAIAEIALYQGVKRPLMQGGSAVSSTVPVVAGRPALVRLFVTTNAAYGGAPVTARLYVGEGKPPVEVVQAINGSPSEASLGSTVNFEVPAELMTVGASFRVELLQPPGTSPADNPGAFYPASGSVPLGAQSPGQTLRITLVPIAYGADGSNRLPDTSPQQIQRYEDAFYAMYPVPQLDLTVRQAVSWNGGVYANGSGWVELLDGLGQLRESDGAPFDMYYYGVFSPESTLDGYCGGGCVAGLGNLGGANDAWSRAAIGLGFAGDMSAETAVHEIGHTHGRQHAPCGGAQGVDGSFPYSGASIGSWGYDLVHKKLLSPQGTKDMMGYCYPIWVSDYTFKALFNRMKAVNGAAMVFSPELSNRTYERVRLGSDGLLEVLPNMKLRTPPMGEAVKTTLEGPGGKLSVDGQYFPYDHLEGGVLMWPETRLPYDALQVELSGNAMTFTK